MGNFLFWARQIRGLTRVQYVRHMSSGRWSWTPRRFRPRATTKSFSTNEAFPSPIDVQSPRQQCGPFSRLTLFGISTRMSRSDCRLPHGSLAAYVSLSATTWQASFARFRDTTPADAQPSPTRRTDTTAGSTTRYIATFSIRLALTIKTPSRVESIQ